MNTRPPDESPGGPAPEDGAGAGRRAAPARWAAVHEHFQVALDLAGPQREALLARLDAEDPAVAAEVRSLLAADERAGAFLEDSPAALPAIRPGDRIGPYRVIGEVGRGGMGVVVRATRDDGTYMKDVAIKLIEPGMRSAEILRRFRAERQILALLEHPRIARLLDGGTAADGSPYLVMEFVDGRPLLEWCDAARLGMDERLRLFLEICDAVQFAHQRLVVHRDLKSDNVLVGEDGIPHLLDFGIARLIAREGDPEGATLTVPLQRRLTPEYASPEQIRGEPAAVSGDVYSLGVILYELLAGTRPVQLAGRTTEDMLRVLEARDAAAPSGLGAALDDAGARARGFDTTARWRARLAGDLDAIVLRALEHDPGRRYPTVERLAADVRRHLEGEPITARRASATYRVSRWVRRHRVPVAFSAVAALALAAGLAGTLWQAAVARQERDRALRRFDDVKSLAHAVMFDLHDAIEKLPGSTRARELLVDEALHYLDRLRREAGGDPALQSELAIAYGKIGDVQGRPMYPNLGRTSEALASYDRALALLASVARAWPESASVVHNTTVVRQRRADLLHALGRPAEGLSEHLRARDRVRADLTRHPDDPILINDLCVSYSRLIDLEVELGDTTAALADGRAYLATVERIARAGGADPGARRGLLIASTKLAQMLEGRAAPDSVLVHYRRAETLARGLVHDDSESTEALRDLSIVLAAEGLYLVGTGAVDSGLVIHERAAELTAQLAAKDPDNVLAQADVADNEYETGELLLGGRRPTRANQRFAAAYEGYERLAAADSSNQEFRIGAARSARRAAEASALLARGARSSAERERWSAREYEWLTRSQACYRRLARAGALVGPEVHAPDEVAALLARARAGRY